VRDLLPAEVLAGYDKMKSTIEDLWESPELFAMAVMTDTYRSLSPSKRKKFLGHYGCEPCLSISAHKPHRRHCNGELNGRRWR
jgi:hypothetical protein